MSYEITGEDDTYTVAVTIKDGANVGVPDARVTLYGGGVYYESKLTGEDGTVSFTGVPVFTGGKLTAWKHNYLPKIDPNVNVP